MKKRINNIALALLLTLSSCVEDMNVPGGWITIEPPVKVEETRSAPEIDYLVSISRGSSIIMAPTRYSLLNGSITLPTADCRELHKDRGRVAPLHLWPTPLCRDKGICGEHGPVHHSVREMQHGQRCLPATDR